MKPTKIAAAKVSTKRPRVAVPIQPAPDQAAENPEADDEPEQAPAPKRKGSVVEEGPESNDDSTVADPDKPKVDEDELKKEARERFARCETEGQDNRDRYKEALDFMAGDQWDSQLKQSRIARRLPCLTFDRLSTHINLVVNAQRQNKPAIKVRPVDSTGDVKIAEIYDGIIRHIEAVSNANIAYETAGLTQTLGGVGYWRILTQFKDETAFEQDIVIQRVTNPLSIFMDPDAKEQDASDAHFCFVVTDWDRKRFEQRYGEDAESASWQGEDPQGWWSKDTVRLAEYFRVIHRVETLLLFDDGTSAFESDYEESVEKGGDAREIVKQRKGRRRVVEWFLLGGDTILDSRIWPGRWIPIVRIVGNEVEKDGKLMYTGLTHRLMDPQRALNYWTSKVTEAVASVANAPYIGVRGQFAGVEGQWKNANTTNPAYLEYNHVDVNGEPAGRPTRESPPQVPSGATEIVNMMEEDMRWISGQQQANFGAPSNEQSGRAILARQQQGDTATYHYVDNEARGITHTGRIIVDMVPRVMDTRQIIRALGEDGTSKMVVHDPDQQQAVSEELDDQEEVHRIFNLGVGRYDVETTVGPNFATRRQESVDALQALFQANPDLWHVVGDIYLRNQDWPGAQDMADRVAKTINPALKSDPDNPQGPQAQMAQMHQAMAQLQQQGQQSQAKLQFAQENADKADQEIAGLKADLLRAQTDIQAKTASAQASADASKYADDTKWKIAVLNARKDEADAAVTALGANVVEIQQVLAALSHYVGATAPAATSEPETMQ